MTVSSGQVVQRLKLKNKLLNLYEIFDWYEDHKNHMILSDNTRELVDEILSQIKEKLDEEPDVFSANKE